MNRPFATMGHMTYSSLNVILNWDFLKVELPIIISFRSVAMK